MMMRAFLPARSVRSGMANASGMLIAKNSTCSMIAASVAKISASAVTTDN